LGVGTLAAYGRAGDQYRYYEINPHSVEIAQRDFSFLGDSPAEQRIVLGDARQMLQAEFDRGEANQFDVLVIDAFSSDSIPMHLITQEAMAVYRRHLKPGGIIAFHVSNLFLRLSPVVELLARDADLQSVQIVSKGEYPERRSTWVLVTDDGDFLRSADVRRRASPITPIPGLRLWTDSYNNLFDILR
jgi:spermidine synthase